MFVPFPKPCVIVIVIALILNASCFFSFKERTNILAPALFIFGDSLVDVGNNNHLTTLAKVDYYPYGMDFPSHLPTGRFTNGYNPSDYFAFKLGLPLIPAYNNPMTKGDNLLNGVNFASGGSGIQSYTGRIYGHVISMREQVRNYKEVKEKINAIKGENATNELFTTAIHLLVTGSNDWLSSYYNPIFKSPIHSLYNITQYRDKLIDRLTSYIEKIYKIGGRNIVVAGLPPLGCCPSQMAHYHSNGTCVEFLNNISKDFSKHLLSQVMNLNEQLPNANVFFINVYTITLGVFQKPSKYGFKITNVACCGVESLGGVILCLKGSHPCNNVEDYMYWDGYHPTQNFYSQFVDIMWNHGPPYTYPTSLQNHFNHSSKS